MVYPVLGNPVKFDKLFEILTFRRKQPSLIAILIMPSSYGLNRLEPAP